MTKMSEMPEQISPEDRNFIDHWCPQQGFGGLCLQLPDIALKLAALRQRSQRGQGRLNHITSAGIPDQPLRPTLLQMKRARWQRNDTFPFAQQM